MLPYAGVSFLAHDIMGDILASPRFAPYTILPLSKPRSQDPNKAKRPPFRSWAELTAGGVAGLVAQTVSYPLEVVRRRMQIGGALESREFRGITETIRGIYQSSGLRGFFVGLTIGYIKVTPMVATSFFVSISSAQQLGLRAYEILFGHIRISTGPEIDIWW